MTREEVVKWLESLKKEIGKAENRTLWHYAESIDMAIEALADRPTGWIPVSKRLPIPPTFCLVTTDGSHGDVIDIALYMSDGWHKASEVLAWMPLPPPYEGDDEHE